MKKKRHVSGYSPPVARSRVPERSWHNGGDIEIGFYARSLHRAAKVLIETLDPQPDTKTAWDACPIILLYKQSVELQLKALVDEGSNFLPSPTDPLSLAKTHSLRWLAQISSQLIKTVGWENEFKCDGVASLADFSALVSELEALDPVAVAVRSGNRRPDGGVPHQLQPVNVVQFAMKLDALLVLLDATADALAAMWEKESGEEKFHTGDDFEPTIQ